MPTATVILPTQSRASLILACVASVLLLAGAMWLIWKPVFDHYRVRVDSTPAAVLADHRSKPVDEVLSIVADVSMMTDHPLSGQDAVIAADRILKGELALPALDVLPIDIQFDPKDLERGVPVQQVWMASLLVPDLLLRAYEETRSIAYLDAARIYIENFCRFESRQWLPTGFLWNAHSVANRVAVLTRLWKFERLNDEADPSTAALIHDHVQRVGALLSKHEHFVGATNHGVMQNVALLQIATAFPSLPDSPKFRELALARLKKQLPFYISSEGVVLEHSAGYHFHGTVITGFLIRLLNANGQSVPTELANAHEKSLTVLRDLQRPNASLPLIGNTYRYEWKLPALLDRAESAETLKTRSAFSRLYPVAGYAVWSNPEAAGEASTHTVIPWGYFAGHGHRRAQEMSLSIWSDADWITNTGYWPGSDTHGMEQSNGWVGGNAPHVLGETVGQRKTVLSAYTHADAFRFLDMERRSATGAAIRRQTMQIGQRDWIALDTYSDTHQRALRTIWTAAPESEVESIFEAPGIRRYEFRRRDDDSRLRLSLLGPEELSAKVLRGSLDPFGGWVAHSRKAHPAPSVDARIPHVESRWMLAAFSLQHRADKKSAANMERFASPDEWSVVLAEGESLRRVSRDGDEISITEGSNLVRHALHNAPNVEDELSAIESASAAVRAEYPRVRLYEPERVRVSLVLAVTWVGMLAATWACWRWRYRPRAAWFTLHTAWATSVLGLVYFYLQ